MHWENEKQVNVIIPFALSETTGSLSFSEDGLAAAVSSMLSGTVEIDGVDIEVTAIGIPTTADAPNTNIISVDPSVTRSHIDRIGGDRITLRADAPVEVAAHELGHAAGAGDQYPGGIDAYGKRIPNTVEQTRRTLMGDRQGPANEQTLREILRPRSN